MDATVRQRIEAEVAQVHRDSLAKVSAAPAGWRQVRPAEGACLPQRPERRGSPAPARGKALGRWAGRSSRPSRQGDLPGVDRRSFTASPQRVTPSAALRQAFMSRRSSVIGCRFTAMLEQNESRRLAMAEIR
jgi:hypothetical protein